MRKAAVSFPALARRLSGQANRRRLDARGTPRPTFAADETRKCRRVPGIEPNETGYRLKERGA